MNLIAIWFELTIQSYLSTVSQYQHYAQLSVLTLYNSLVINSLSHTLPTTCPDLFSSYYYVSVRHQELKVESSPLHTYSKPFRLTYSSLPINIHLQQRFLPYTNYVLFLSHHYNLKITASWRNLWLFRPIFTHHWSHASHFRMQPSRHGSSSSENLVICAKFSSYGQ